MKGFVGLVKVELPNSTAYICDGGFIDYDGDSYKSSDPVLGVISSLEPLSEGIGDDIPALADHFFARYAADQGVPPPQLAPELLASLQAYEWPGNVRQLKNLVERTLILTPREKLDQIEADMLPSEISGEEGGGEAGFASLMGVPLREARECFEREYLQTQIRRFSGNISKTAQFVGMERSALHRKLKLLGMGDRSRDKMQQE